MKSIAKLFLFISLSINCIYCYASEQVNDDRNQCTPITITANAPYTEDFSSYSGTSASSTSGVMPDCWDALFLGTPSYIGYAPHVFYGSSQCPHGSSNNCLLMYAGSTDYGPSSYAIFPKYTNDMTTLELKFSVAMSTNFSSPKLTLGYVTDATNSNSFVALRTFSNNLVSENGVANYDIRLNTYSFPAGARLCFRWTASWESCYIDDVVVRLIPSCIAPNDLAYSNLTAGGVLLEWTPAGSESAWEIDYGTVGHTAGSGSSAVAYGHPYSLGGLVPGNNYDVYVRADCGGGNDSEWSGPVSFRVPCAPATVTATAPYTEDFAAYGGTSASSTSGVMPDCWDMLFFGTLNHLGYAPHVFYGGSYAPNGNNNNCLLMYAGSTDYGPSSYAILPQFTNDLATLEIDFSVAMSTNFSSPRLSLGYLSDMTDANTFVAIQTFPNNLISENGVADYQIRLDGGTYPAGARLCFRWTASWESCYIDDVVVRLIPSCIAPDDLAYSNLTSGGVLLEWTPAGSESAWEIDYGTVGHAAGSGSSAVAYGHPYSLGGLVPGNSYDVYVRADCGGGNDSEWSGPVSFRVPCAPATVTATAPYTEDFAAYGGTSASSTSGVMPDCWDMLFFGTLNHLGYAPHVFYGGSYAPNGNNNNCLLMYAGSTDYGPSSYAILPQFTNDLATLEIDFSVAMSTNFSSPRLSLGYLSDMTDANTFVAIQTFPNNLVSENGVADYQIRLDGGTYPAGARLCFRWTASWESCYIDDVVVRLIPSCIAPDNLAYSNLTSGGVLLEWTPAGSESAWEIDYGTVGHAAGSGSSAAAYGHPYSLGGLVPGNSYDVYVRADCGGGNESEWSGPVSFRVPCAPATVTATAPYTEDFAAYGGTSASSTSGVMPDCWDMLFFGTLNHLGYAPHVFYGGSYAPNGNNNNCLLMYAGSTDYGPSSYAILPQFTNDLATLEIDFSVAMSTNFSSPRLSLGYLSDMTDANTFVAIQTFPNNLVSENGVADYQIRLDGGTYPAGARLCFRWTASWESCYIDDVVVRLIYNTIDTTVCSNELPFTWNGVTFNDAGSQWAVLTTADNTDSLVLMNLNLFMPSYNTVDTTVCAGVLPFTWNGVTFTSAGTQVTTLSNQMGCDSILTMNVSILPGGTYDFNAEACGSYTWNGTIYTQGGDYTQTISTPGGCDSIITLHLTIWPMPEITISGNTEIANGGHTTLTASGAQTYQWSTGSTLSSIIVSPFESTLFTVVGTNEYGCTSSASIWVDVITGITEQETSYCDIYPNPAHDHIVIQWENSDFTTIEGGIYTLEGRLVQVFRMNSATERIDLHSLANGIYVVRLFRNGNVIESRKIVITSL